MKLGCVVLGEVARREFPPKDRLVRAKRYLCGNSQRGYPWAAPQKGPAERPHERSRSYPEMARPSVLVHPYLSVTGRQQRQAKRCGRIQFRIVYAARNQNAQVITAIFT
jgi:hypothetical protein